MSASAIEKGGGALGMPPPAPPRQQLWSWFQSQQGGWQHLAFHPPRCWPWIWRVCVSHLKVLDAERGSAKIRIGATNDCLPGCLYVGCS